MNEIRTLTILFSNPINEEELKYFRGAVISSLENKDILFHNHSGEGYRYSYPLIQYKRIHQKAAIFCLGEGIDSIYELFRANNFTFQLKDRIIEAKLDKIETHTFRMGTTTLPIYYRISNWLPLNKKNYEAYIKYEDVKDRISLLERILTANIISMLKGLEIHVENDIHTTITNILNQRFVIFKGVKLLSLDLEFKTDFQIPNYIGLGKSVSLGFGNVSQLK